MKSIAFAVMALALIPGSLGAAHAQRYTNYPVCAFYGPITVSCAFDTMAQCFASVSGRGGWCEMNGDYRPPARAKRGKNAG